MYVCMYIYIYIVRPSWAPKTLTTLQAVAALCESWLKITGGPAQVEAAEDIFICWFSMSAESRDTHGCTTTTANPCTDPGRRASVVANTLRLSLWSLFRISCMHARENPQVLQVGNLLSFSYPVPFVNLKYLACDIVPWSLWKDVEMPDTKGTTAFRYPTITEGCAV